MQQCAVCNQPAMYKDQCSGSFLCPAHLKLGCFSESSSAKEGQDKDSSPSCLSNPIIQLSTLEDQPQIKEIVHVFWGESGEVHCFERTFQLLTLPVYCAKDENGTILSILAWTLLQGRGLIAGLATLPEYQRRGLGSQMVEFLAQQIRDIRLNEMIIAVNNSNLPALGFCYKNGFHLENVHHYDSEAPVTPNPVIHSIPVRDELQLVRSVAS